MAHLFYTKLAQHYDKIYSFVDYEKQAAYFSTLIDIFGTSKNKNVLDLACGTGKHANVLQHKGFNITGVDASNEMLAQAHKRNFTIQFKKGDMRTFLTDEKFDIVLIFFNSILYNKNVAEMRSTLGNCYNHLENGGILIFDVVDKSIGLDSKKESHHYEGDLTILFEPQWIYNEEEDVMDLHIDFDVNGKKIHDHHIMGAFSFDELRQFAEDVGFSVTMLERDFDGVKTLKKSSKKAIFVCKK